MKKIMIAEDDAEIALLERDYLEMNGYEVDVVENGVDVIPRLLKNEYGLLLLDIMLPGKNGYDICREVRDKIDIPILMVTARSESPDKIRGLGIGADDYIAKPFDPGELVARVRSHIKRYKRLVGESLANGISGRLGAAPDSLSSAANTAANTAGTVGSTSGAPLAASGGAAAQYADCDGQDCIRIGDLRIMTQGWLVYRGDETIKLPNREFELLKFLAENPNIVFSKDTLFEKIWGYDYVGDSATVTVHINRIREKIEETPSAPKIIETIWGVGYRLNPS